MDHHTMQKMWFRDYYSLVVLAPSQVVPLGQTSAHFVTFKSQLLDQQKHNCRDSHDFMIASKIHGIEGPNLIVMSVRLLL